MLPKKLVAATAEPLVLSLLARGPHYGYELIQEMASRSGGRVAWKANRLYPLLHDLENRGLVTAQWQEQPNGRQRKYYHLTPAGEQAVASVRSDWFAFHQLLCTLWDVDASPQPG